MKSGSHALRVDMAVLADVARYLKSRDATGYLVGGAVRDSLSGRGTTDIDIVVEGARPVGVARHLGSTRGFSRPVLFKRSGTVFTNDGVTEVEICPLRGGLKEDALERDFTVNCLYVKLRPGLKAISRRAVLDPTGLGLRDLRAGRLRAYPDCFTPFASDPLRLLRAVRFYATPGLSIGGDLKRAMRRMAFLASRPSAERVRDELMRILLSSRVRSSFALMRRTGLLHILLPEVAATADFDQGSPYHAYDLLTHTLKSTAYVRPEPALRLAALFHDIGKVDSRMRKGGRFVYYGHEKRSAAAARAIMERLRFPLRLAGDVAFLVENHMVNYSNSWTDAAVRRFMRKMGGRLDDVLELARADRRAHAPDSNTGTPVRELGRRVAGIQADMEAGKVSLESPLDGVRIMELLGMKPGPDVGKAKEYLCRAVLRRGREISEDEAARMLLRWARKRGKQPR